MFAYICSGFDISGQTDRLYAFSVRRWIAGIDALPMTEIQVCFHLLLSLSKISLNPSFRVEICMEVVGVFVPTLDTIVNPIIVFL